jgi:hypothetical protein
MASRGMITRILPTFHFARGLQKKCSMGSANRRLGLDQGTGKGFMPRFVSNRSWAFILALGILCACGSSIPSPSRAESTAQIGGGTDGGGSGGGTGTNIGDPDNPSGKNSRIYRMLGGVDTNRTYSMGDGVRTGSVWMMRLQIVLQIQKRLLLRY